MPYGTRRSTAASVPVRETGKVRSAAPLTTRQDAAHQGEATEVQVYPLQNSDRRHFHEKGYTHLQHDEWLHSQLQAFQTEPQSVQQQHEEELPKLSGDMKGAALQMLCRGRDASKPSQ